MRVTWTAWAVAVAFSWAVDLGFAAHQVKDHNRRALRAQKRLAKAEQDDRKLIEEVYLRILNRKPTKAEMDAVSCLPVYGMFAWSHMDAEIDRPIYNPDEPSLSEMTAKAIELLSKNPNGFFLMVEGSEVDWAGHNNDPVWMVTDFIEFDNAVKVAVDFAKRDGKTAVVTGGARGIGYATAELMAATGADIAICLNISTPKVSSATGSPVM